MYARMNICYNERGSRTNYVRFSIPHCICCVCARACVRRILNKAERISMKRKN